MMSVGWNMAQPGAVLLRWRWLPSIW